MFSLLKRMWLVAAIILFMDHSAPAHPKSSLLWKISGNGLLKPCYLYGTVHSFEKRAFRFAKLAEQYIAKCDVFGMEINMETMHAKGIFGLMKYIRMPKDTSLRMLLDTEEYAKVDLFFRDSLHFSLGMFNKIKPIFLIGIADAKSGMRDTSHSTHSIRFLDSYLMQRAEQHDKRIIGIETIEEQIKALDVISLKEQARMVLKMVQPDTAKQKVSVEDLVSIYISGDLDSIYRYYKKLPAAADIEFNAALITERNHRMADRIDSIAQDEPIFVAIGALHLPGEEGVISLLRKKGYDVTPIWKKEL
jgi:uncharacterized protein YbaP (TraB family)